MELLDLSVKLDLYVDSSELIVVAEQLYKIADDAQSSFIGVDDVEIHVWVEQGSISKRTKIIIGWGFFFQTVCGIDSFIGGLEKIAGYSEKVINYVTTRIIERDPTKILEVRRSSGLPGKITDILRKVQQGKCSPEDATDKVMKLIEVEDGDSHSKETFLTSFTVTAERNFRSPLIQLKMFPEEEIKASKKPSPIKRSSPETPLRELSLQGIELWYDKKLGRKEIRMYTK